MTQHRNNRMFSIICLGLAVVTAIAYLPVLKADFINFDDPQYVTSNPYVMLGLSLDSIRWAFTSTHASNWHPLTWLSLMFDRQIFGSGPTAFHLVNLLLHIVNSILLFIVLNRLTKAFWPSASVAALFALHPLHVESVAWVAERKDVLCTLFWLLTMFAYVRFVEQPTKKRYLAILTAFTLGLMAKPMLVTLPFVLLLLDYWPLNRISIKTFRNLLLEKIPLFALTAVSCVVTFLIQKNSGAVSTLRVFSFSSRLINAVISYTAYIKKLFAPFNLAIFYPHQGNSLTFQQAALPAITLLIISIIVFSLARTRKYLLVGWLWYLGTLVPVIGLVQVGAQAMADRYTYIPLIGLFIMIAWSVSDISSHQWKYRKTILAFVSVLLLIFLVLLTRKQVSYWQDSITLFQHTANVTRNNDIAYSNLGVALAEAGYLDDALVCFQEALKIKPNDPEANFNIAETLAKQGKPDEAALWYDKVLKLNPGDAHTYVSLAAAKIQQDKFDEAISLCREGLNYNPKNPQLHSNLGLAFLKMGKIDEALTELETAVKLGGDAMAYNNLALAVSAKGDYDAALEYYRRAISLEPKNAESYYNLANLYMILNKPEKAVEEYKKAIQINPRYSKAYGNLAVALARLNRHTEALENFTKVVDLEPNSTDANFNLATALMGAGQFDKAAEHYRKVLALDPNDTEARKGLDAAVTAQNKQK